MNKKFKKNDIVKFKKFVYICEDQNSLGCMQFKNVRGFVENSWINLDGGITARIDWDNKKMLREVDQDIIELAWLILVFCYGIITLTENCN